MKYIIAVAAVFLAFTLAQDVAEEKPADAAVAAVGGEGEEEVTDTPKENDDLDASFDPSEPTAEGCPTNPTLGKCCGSLPVLNTTKHCCGNTPVLPVVHEERCCNVGLVLEFNVPLLKNHMCCAHFVVTKIGLKCCPGEISNFPFGATLDCPKDRKQ